MEVYKLYCKTVNILWSGIHCMYMCMLGILISLILTTYTVCRGGVMNMGV